jgi:hypothetical protein
MLVALPEQSMQGTDLQHQGMNHTHARRFKRWACVRNQKLAMLARDRTCRRQPRMIRPLRRTDLAGTLT